MPELRIDPLTGLRVIVAGERGSRPGAFLDMITQMGGDRFAKGRLIWFGSPTVPLSFVLTQDLAGYLADAVDAPGVDGQRIDIGWDRPVSIEEIAQISGRLLGQRVRGQPVRRLSPSP